LQVRCLTLIQQKAHAPARGEALRRKQELSDQFEAAVASKARPREIARIGITQEELEDQSAGLPLSVADYLALDSRYAALVEEVRALCQQLVESGLFSELHKLASKFKDLRQAFKPEPTTGITVKADLGGGGKAFSA
jgi:hypothetical protein